MKNLFIGLFIPVILILSGCATIKGNTVAEQRKYVLDMRDSTLEKLYVAEPLAKSQIKSSAGYGVFSNINTNLFLLSTASGFGAVTERRSKKVTYMKMASAGGGIGLGVKDFRAIIIFRKKEDMQKFIDQGWEFSGQADAAFKSGDKGGAVSGAKSADLDVITYQLTESGAALQATLQGTKYWRHKDLNS